MLDDRFHSEPVLARSPGCFRASCETRWGRGTRGDEGPATGDDAEVGRVGDDDNLALTEFEFEFRGDPYEDECVELRPFVATPFVWWWPSSSDDGGGCGRGLSRRKKSAAVVVLGLSAGGVCGGEGEEGEDPFAVGGQEGPLLEMKSGAVAGPGEVDGSRGRLRLAAEAGVLGCEPPPRKRLTPFMAVKRLVVRYQGVRRVDRQPAAYCVFCGVCGRSVSQLFRFTASVQTEGWNACQRGCPESVGIGMSASTSSVAGVTRGSRRRRWWLKQLGSLVPCVGSLPHIIYSADTNTLKLSNFTGTGTRTTASH